MQANTVALAVRPRKQKYLTTACSGCVCTQEGWLALPCGLQQLVAANCRPLSLLKPRAFVLLHLGSLETGEGGKLLLKNSQPYSFGPVETRSVFE